MEGLNIEITTCCPLRCPQCYCSLIEGRHISLKLAQERLLEAKNHGVSTIHLSGGETMCYPWIYELVGFSSSLNMKTNIAISGWNYDHIVHKKFVEAGVNGIFVSLNGSTEEVNAITRNGYEYAINALSVLAEERFTNSYINWVMHSNNSHDFENMIALAEKYRVNTLVVLAFKPDSSCKLDSFPSGEQIKKVASIIKAYRGPVKLMVESCFSQLLAIVRNTVLFGNLNLGPTMGCRAALYNYNITVDGKYSPCRHLDYAEDHNSLDEYLAKSKVVESIRKVGNIIEKPCSECRYMDNCHPCLAVNSKMKRRIYIGNDNCSLWKD